MIRGTHLTLIRVSRLLNPRGETRNRNRGEHTMSGDGEDIENSPAAAAATRIFVGGLGATVAAEDLQRTFGCLGRIDSVEIVRTKGRSFAYLDFVPCSEKSLSKLFSMYNGCMWKGGRLKLEKAKEHYFLRLKREWSEDAELANSGKNDAADATKSMDSCGKVNKVMDQKTSEIRLFFPKLRKLRPLPFNGSGKHKYSFQRIEVPPLPIHFCDCDEHSKPLYCAREKKNFSGETQDGVIDEKELNIMESVMNKLFEREDKSQAGTNLLGLVNERKKPLYDNEAADSIDDNDENLVMNMVAMDNVSKGSLKSLKQKTNLDIERALSDGLCISEDMRHRIKTLPSEKKRKSSNAETNDGKVARIDIESKRSSRKTHPHDLVREADKVSATKKTNIDASLLKMRENSLKPAISRPFLADEGEAASEPVDDIAVDDNEADDMMEKEEDGLVLNMVGGSNIGQQATQGWRQETILDNKGAVTDGIQISKFKPSDGKLKIRSSKISASKKNRKSPHTNAADVYDVSIDIEYKKSPRKACPHDSTQATGIISTQKSNIDSSLSKQDNSNEEKFIMKCSPTKEKSNSDGVENQNENQNLWQDLSNLKSQSNSSMELREAAAPLEKPNAGTDKQPKKGTLWAQKSSWTDLVGRTNTSFSISQLLPATNFEKQEQPKNFFAAKSTFNEPSENLVKLGCSASSSDGGPKASSGVVKEKATISPFRYSVGETCSFMRTDSSMKEWKSTKAALSESLKKKA